MSFNQSNSCLINDWYISTVQKAIIIWTSTIDSNITLTEYKHCQKPQGLNTYQSILSSPDEFTPYNSYQLKHKKFQEYTYFAVHECHQYYKNDEICYEKTPQFLELKQYANNFMNSTKDWKPYVYYAVYRNRIFEDINLHCLQGQPVKCTFTNGPLFTKEYKNHVDAKLECDKSAPALKDFYKSKLMEYTDYSKSFTNLIDKLIKFYPNDTLIYEFCSFIKCSINKDHKQKTVSFIKMCHLYDNLTTYKFIEFQKITMLLYYLLNGTRKPEAFEALITTFSNFHYINNCQSLSTVIKYLLFFSNYHQFDNSSPLNYKRGQPPTNPSDSLLIGLIQLLDGNHEYNIHHSMEHYLDSNPDTHNFVEKIGTSIVYYFKKFKVNHLDAYCSHMVSLNCPKIFAPKSTYLPLTVYLNIYIDKYNISPRIHKQSVC